MNSSTIPCAHCRSTGTCSTGENGRTCVRCAGRYKSADGLPPMGLFCRVCEGRGVLENHTLKLQNRFVPYFAGFVVLVLIAFLVCAYFIPTARKDGLTVVLGFVGPIIGTITGFYFRVAPNRETTAPKQAAPSMPSDVATARHPTTGSDV